jgi:RNA polymerase sigma-70 factor, ECF subfamily
MAGTEPAQEVRPNKGREAEERRLVEAAQRDPARFADLYENYFELVYAYVARRVRSRHEAEDLTAEVFHKALRSLPRFKWTGAPFAAWLFRIASNMIADRAKRAAREQSVALDEDLASPAVAELQSSVEEVERRAHLFRLVDKLAEDQRRIVVMRFAQEKSIREIAQTLGRSEGAVKQLQFRALQNLRAKLAGNE